MAVIRLNNLYEHFGCSSKEELYQKVAMDDVSVRSLVDFIDFSKGEMNSGEKGISSPQDFIEFAMKNRMPSKDEMVSVFCSTKNEPLYLSRYSIDDQVRLKKVLKEGLNAGGVSMFYLSNSSVPNGKEVEMEDYFKTFGIDVLDGFHFNEFDNTITSNKERLPYHLDNFASSNVAEGDSINYSLQNNDINTYRGFDEFTSYFANQEIVGIHVMEDNAKLKRHLKVGYQYDWQEFFGVIACDSDGKVVTVNELFKGSPNASIVDKKVFTKELLSREDVSKVAVFHNHPSGVPEPSLEDMNVTRGLKEVSEKLDIQLLDHFIVGKRNVFSIAKEYPEYVSENEDYKEIIQKQSEMKNNKQGAFEMEL